VNPVEELLCTRRVVASVGTGGVGKTTVAAALALCAARLGRRSLVLTIDPARRLADALGVEVLGDTPQAIPREVLTELGVPASGTLFAMMLDMKHSFDDLVERLAPDAGTRRRILDNPIYQHVSDALAGSAEYVAMEEVYEMAQRSDFDLIVLDTPPSAHALDFLEAPERLIGLLDSRLVQLLVHPAMSAGRLGLRFLQRGAHQAFRLLERISGLGFLEDVSEFLLAFEGMSEGFRTRAREVRGLLFGEHTRFVLVTTPAEAAVRQAEDFLARLSSAGAPLAGLVVNRVHAWPGPPPTRVALQDSSLDALAKALARDADPGFPARQAAAAALGILRSYAAMVGRDQAASAPLVARIRRSGGFARCVPELSRDVHDLRGLARVADRLLADDPGDASRTG